MRFNPRRENKILLGFIKFFILGSKRVFIKIRKIMKLAKVWVVRLKNIGKITIAGNRKRKIVNNMRGDKYENLLRLIIFSRCLFSDPFREFINLIVIFLYSK